MSAPRSNARPTPEFLASVVEHSDDAIITKDLNGRVTSRNKSAEWIFGYTAAEMIGNTISILAALEQIDEMPDILRRVGRGERIDQYQTLRRTKDGRIPHVSLTVSPVKDTPGRIIGASKIARGITEQVRAAERLAELNAALLNSEAQARQARDWLETMLQGIGDALIATDANGGITLWNAVAESLTEWCHEEATGRSWDEVFVISNEETGATVKNPVHRGMGEGRIIGLANHTLLAARDGRLIPIDDSAAPFRNPEGKILGVLLFRDVIARKYGERQLIDRNDQPSSIADNMAAGVTPCSSDFRYIWVSSAYASWLRRSKDQIEGYYIQHIIGEQAYAVILPYMESVLIYVPTWSQGQVDGWTAVVIDITDTVRYEEQLRDAHAELARANLDLSQFAFTASHDLQEPRLITSYSQLLMKGYRGQLGGDAATCVECITAATKRVGELLAHAQVTGEESAEPVDLSLVFRQMLENSKAAIEESPASVTRGPLPVVPGHNPHFVQLFQNLIGNALKYRSERPPRIHVSALNEDGMWRLAVADNGIGIDPQYHQSVFGVFDGLHAKTIPGAGIGLAICQRAVERSGGRIWVESQPGQGATFCFTLSPLRETAAHGA
jgi:PAS domain S-box-containing protein